MSITRTISMSAYEAVEKERQLQAAAPDLLVALKGLLDVAGDFIPQDYSPLLGNARAAIAKAEGESK